jgi:hypothetical protein
MGRIGEPKREIHIPVPPPTAPHEEPAPVPTPATEPATEPVPADPVPAGA